MALPGGRRIEVNSKKYTWVVRGSEDRYRTGWTSPEIKLTIRDEETGKVRQFRCTSLHWTKEHESVWRDGDAAYAADHKIPFPPGIVAQVLNTPRFPYTHGDDWKITPWR